MTSYDVVVPTTGRSSLAALLGRLAEGPGPRPERVLVVDDRRRPDPPLHVPADVTVLRGPARGPAAARNVGWRAGRAKWVAFLDDDVLPEPGWSAALAADLDTSAGASQGRVVVPLATDRAPTDWERNVAGLERARWATADMAYRRAVLAAVGGFDERFPRAYREDSGLGLRVTAAGWRIERGARRVVHPVGDAPARVSLTKQAGNADDVLMRVLHGRGWRERAGAPAGRLPRHLATAAAGTAAALTALAGRPRPAAACAATWLAGTGELAWARIAPGPRTRPEVATMLWTSAAMPFVATAWWLRGLARVPRVLADRPRPCPPPRTAAWWLRGLAVPRALGDRPGPCPPPRTAASALRGLARVPRARPAPCAVLFDRDDTLIEDVPYNGDPARVKPLPGARAALARLRAESIPTAVVSNQSGIARGHVTHAQVAAVNRRLEELLGPLGPVEYCPHAPGDGCDCRKPAPGLVLRAAARLGVDARDCALVGDIGSDVEAALAAGARPVLVPTARTRVEEIAAAPHRAPHITAAIELLLDGRRP
jgi:histidinol-phosphate phosphatase family protein